ncbi:MAG TPA: DUF362 domain-containing protein, partial [Candidatus Acidoferrum sp.]|nr:DUF362 domain-containing protein [Candidatus Acidoferrum sp.]
MPVVLAGVGRGASEQALKAAVRAGVEAATDFAWLSKGDAVFIKPALNSGKPYPATTSPIAIGAMVELLKDKGAGRVLVGDMAGILHVKLSRNGLSGSSRRLMEASGMARAAQAAGAELHFFEEAGWDAFYEDLPVAGSHWQRGVMMPKILQEVDHIILMPRCARHSLAGSTLGLKAAVGYWRTDTRLEYHRDAITFQEKTAEGNTVDTLRRKLRLALSAAERILATFGPDDGQVIEPETGLVIASESVVAHDMVSLAWLLENRRSGLPAEVGALDDPYRSQLFVSIGNHWVVNKLDGLGSALASERLTRNDINTIWDDRVLHRAFEVLGGVPLVTLASANTALPEALKQRLGEMTTRAL